MKYVKFEEFVFDLDEVESVEQMFAINDEYLRTTYTLKSGRKISVLHKMDVYAPLFDDVEQA
jgi:hypothetical protein